jgi:hypothetical protein
VHPAQAAGGQGVAGSNPVTPTEEVAGQRQVVPKGRPASCVSTATGTATRVRRATAHHSRVSSSRSAASRRCSGATWPMRNCRTLAGGGARRWPPAPNCGGRLPRCQRCSAACCRGGRRRRTGPVGRTDVALQPVVACADVRQRSPYRPVVVGFSAVSEGRHGTYAHGCTWRRGLATEWSGSRLPRVGAVVGADLA